MGVLVDIHVSYTFFTVVLSFVCVEVMWNLLGLVYFGCTWS